MKPKDLFRYGCTNLFRRKTRTALTALSMAVGVMCIVVLISVGLGYEQAYRESIEALGSLTKIDVTPATGDYGRKALLNDKALEAFRGIDGVEAVTPVYQQSAYIVSGNYVNMVRVYGIDMTTAENFMLTPERGVMAEDGTRLHPEVLFTDDVAAGLANKAKDWELAVDENGNALIDLLEVPVRMTFDSSSLTGEPKADTDGRALPSSKPLYPAGDRHLLHPEQQLRHRRVHVLRPLAGDDAGQRQLHGCDNSNQDSGGKGQRPHLRLGLGQGQERQRRAADRQADP